MILQQLGFGGGVFLFGFSIVFFGLICLLGYISLQSLFFKGSKKKAKQPEQKIVTKPSNDFISQTSADDTEEVIAAITAAVAMYLGTSTGDVMIKSYRRIGANTPAWRQAGRRDSIFNKF